jgi:eukaryotic-like serine/threonine-protein kinase
VSDSSSSKDPPPQREPRQLTLLGPPAPPPPSPPEDAQSQEPPPRRPALARGDVVAGRYRIDGRIGCGGMASVFLAHHVEIEAAVAIKVLDPELAALRGTADRFLLEAKASSLVHHPNVVAISDYGRLDEGLPYIVMEYLVGEDLEDVLRRTGPMPWSRVRGIALQVCAALQAAHDVGVIHRDVKLQNCFCQAGTGGQDFIKVLDFGIAKVTEDLLADRRALARTTEGIVVGTPDYMAPEQGRRGTIDHRADIYSLGVVLFHLVSGRLPFTAKHPIEQMAQHIYEEPPAPSEIRPGIDPRVDALILRALEKNPEDRFASMSEFADAIERLETTSTAVIAVRSDPPPPLRRGRAWAMLGGSALLALLAVVWATRSPEVAVSLPRPRDVPVPLAQSEVEPPEAPTVAAPLPEAAVAAPMEHVEDAAQEVVVPVETIGPMPAPTLVVEPTSSIEGSIDGSIEGQTLQDVLRRFDDDDADELVVPEPAELVSEPSRPRSRAKSKASKTRAKAKRRSLPKASEAPAPETSPHDAASRPKPEPSASDTAPSGTTTPRVQKPDAGSPFRPVDPLKNPYD